MVSLLITYGIDAPGMAARVHGMVPRDFTRSIPWRLNMVLARVYLRDMTDTCLIFDSEMTYKECIDLIRCLNSAEDYGVSAELDSSIVSFIEDQQTFIENRSRVGLAIKTYDPSVDDAFLKFAEIADASMTRPLREKQLWDAFFLASIRWAANFSVPGSGKTASVLGAYAYLFKTNRVQRVVVICPKSAFESWRYEWQVCIDEQIPLKCFCLADRSVARLTKAQKKSLLRLDSGNYNLFLLNYEAIGSYTDELRELCSEGTLLVFDEVHRVKAIDGQRANWALEVAEEAKYVFALTGTPIPNTYQDIYNLLHLLYPRDYRSFFGFEPNQLKNPSDAEIDQINRSFRPFFCRTNKRELGVPLAEPDKIYECNASPAENELLRILRAAYRKNPLALLIRVLQLESDAQMLRYALDPADFEYVLDQVGDDYFDIDFVDYSEDVPKLIDECEKSQKMIRCEKLVMKLASEGKPTIVWCIFVKSILRIAHDLESIGLRVATIYGATPQDDREETLKRFRLGMLDVLVTNPHTLAESVSLHQVCHDGVYFEYSYNLVHLLQSKDRIHRLGLPPEQYTQYYFLQTWFNLPKQFNAFDTRWSLDRRIYDRLMEKEDTMLEAIDGGYLEGGYIDAEDIEIVLGELLSGL